MSLPYENATSGNNAIQDVQKILRGFGCQSFGHMLDYSNGELLVQFVHRNRQVSVRANSNGYAAAWLKEHPYTSRMRCTQSEHQAKAKKISEVAVYSILRDWIKGQVMAIETGILSFDAAFLGQIMLPNGKTVLEHVSATKALPDQSGESL
jgi:hypothetical protein